MVRGSFVDARMNRLRILIVFYFPCFKGKLKWHSRCTPLLGEKLAELSIKNASEKCNCPKRQENFGIESKTIQNLIKHSNKDFNRIHFVVIFITRFFFFIHRHTSDEQMVYIVSIKCCLKSVISVLWNFVWERVSV